MDARLFISCAALNFNPIISSLPSCGPKTQPRIVSKGEVLPDAAKLVERLHQVGLHHGVTQTSDVDDRGRGDAVTVLHAVLQGEENSLDYEHHAW